MTEYLPFAFIGVNSALLGWSLIACWRLHRRTRHVEELDALLAHLCIKCFANQHMPVWRAWIAVMGDISVEVTQNRRMPGDEV